MAGNNPITSWGGGWRVCPECGKNFFVPDLRSYGYKRTVSDKKVSRLQYFCKWSCMRKFDDRYEEAKKQHRIETATAQIRKLNGLRFCNNCRYCPAPVEGQKQYCLMYAGRYVFDKRTACKGFKPKEDDNNVGSGQKIASGRSKGKAK